MKKNYVFVGIEEVMEEYGYSVEEVKEYYGDGVVGIIWDEDREYECIVYEGGRLVEYIVGGICREYENIKEWMLMRDLINIVWRSEGIRVYEYVEEERRMEFMESEVGIVVREEVCCRWDRSRVYGMYCDWFEVFVECFMEW